VGAATFPKRERMSTRKPNRRAVLWVLCALVGTTLAAAASGCVGARRRPYFPWVSRFGRNPYRKDTPGATIGYDIRSAPAGTTIPPAGLGVDLVMKSQ
jgi:hypothetical protein